ncbi:MAG: hypothetical protein Tp178MES00d2C33159091_47 [Prokaryotic dsDNA virus sp.]|uniref:hypothetical protein n=1 Tax=Thalassospira sp. TaxID=1912094 RepID=UPI00118A60DB|nr:hypothetical protein [Thalassospira sp.]QDP60996.1 MAG: hypothetical protein Tp178MES00d2C33159091_47 [Prokaryotic dsDNA virus sp.]QDP64499.1 MAG: hypothetical protein Tp178SUR1139111_19 [Prokaryotic dsDNA virus sp.]|tara:strand:- start:110 stop:283 length:174 start_codon:yes stop_codon:yes gene_type:complete
MRAKANKARGNPDLAAYHNKVKATMQKDGSSMSAAQKKVKAAEMRHYRKKKTPGTGN